MPGLNPTDAEIGQAIINDLGRFGRFLSSPPRFGRLTAPGLSEPSGSRKSYGLGATHQGPAYQDPRFLVPQRGKVGGGNAGASTADQWPASLKGQGSVTPIVTGRGSDGRPDPRQSDQYRAALGQQQAPAYPSFPLTPQGQFERYFSSGSPEMDQYFGAASRGAGAPKTLEEMNALAAMSKAPMTSPLATFYRAQSAAGRGNMDEIISGLGYTGAMAEWAKANPMLAQREYAKKFPGGRSAVSFEPGAVAGLNVPVESAFANRPFATAQVPVETQAFPAQNVLRGVDPYGMPNLMAPTGQGFDTSQLYGKGAPNLAAFTLPGGAMTQGSQVSAPFQQAANMAFQRTNPVNFDVEAQKAAVGDTDLQKRITNFLGTTAVR